MTPTTSSWHDRPISSSFTQIWDTDCRNNRSLAIGLLVVATFVTFFIVEHSLTMSLTSESARDVEFVETDLDAEVESGSTIRKAGFAAFGLLGIALLTYRGPSLDWSSPVPWAATFFVGWIALSVLWATDPSLTIRRVIVILTMTAGVAAFLRLLTPESTADWIGWISLSFVCLGLICELALFQFRPWNADYRFGGTTHPNTLGILCAFSSFYSLARASRACEPRRLLWLGVAAATLLGLYLTKSRTALAAAAMTIGIVWMLRQGWMTRIGATLVGFGIVSAIILGSLILNIDAVAGLIDTVLLGRSDEAITLTGRVPLWAELNRDVAESPVLGYGFGSFWTPEVIYRVRQNQGWTIPHAHSGYYETLLNLGFVGLGLAVLGLTAAFLHALRVDTRSNVAAGMTLAVILFAAFYSLTDTAFALPTFAPFAVAVIALQATRMPLAQKAVQ